MAEEPYWLKAMKPEARKELEERREERRTGRRRSRRKDEELTLRKFPKDEGITWEEYKRIKADPKISKLAKQQAYSEWLRSRERAKSLAKRGTVEYYDPEVQRFRQQQVSAFAREQGREITPEQSVFIAQEIVSEREQAGIFKPAKQVQAELFATQLGVGFQQAFGRAEEYYTGLEKESEKKFQEKVDLAKSQGYHVIIREDDKGKSLEITIPEKKQKELEEYGFTKIGEELKQERPIWSRTALAWFSPISLFTGKTDEAIGRMAYGFEQTQKKYGVGLGSVITSATAPVPVGIASYLGFRGLGTVSGKLAIGGLTGSKIAPVLDIGLKSLTAGIGGYGVAKSYQFLSSKDISRFEKEKFLGVGIAGTIGGALGFKAGYQKAVDPYFQVKSQSLIRGQREQGIVYSKKGLTGSASQELRTVFKQYKGVQFKADTLLQSTYKQRLLLQKGDVKFFLKTGKTIGETTLTGYRIDTGLKGITELPRVIGRDIGVVSLRQVYPMESYIAPKGTKFFTGKGLGAYTGQETGIYSQEYSSVELTKGVGLTTTQAVTFGKVPTGYQFTVYPKQTLPFRPEKTFGITKDTGFFKLGKKGQLALTRTKPTIQPEFQIPTPSRTFITPKVPTILAYTPKITTPATFGVLPIGLLGTVGITDQRRIQKIGVTPISQLKPVISQLPKIKTQFKQEQLRLPKIDVGVTTKMGVSPITMPTIMPPIITPLTPSPPVPILPPILPPFDIGYVPSRRPYKPRRPTRVKKKYTPSLIAIHLGITGERPTRLTGLEIRPLAPLPKRRVKKKATKRKATKTKKRRKSKGKKRSRGLGLIGGF